MEILITNDDSISAEGINFLINFMKPYGNITVVAPKDPQSGKAASLTIMKHMYLEKMSEEKGVKIYSFNGTPVDCVKLAMNSFFKKKKPDLLISGINHGHNTSAAAFYSGTLGAAIEGCLYNIPSVGFSIDDHHKNIDFSAIEKYGRKVIEMIIKNGIAQGSYLNINFPSLPANQILGYKFGHLGKGRWINEFEEKSDDHGKNYWWMTGEFENLEPENPKSDINIINSGYISIVVHKLDNTNYDELSRLKKAF
ncbi:MAG: 5'/3'-nucleotidase SurE [Bacteroidales bacterium]